MSSVNKAIIIGRIGKDPETRHLPDGGEICNVSIATSESWKDKSGVKQEKTEWHRVSFFGKLAEIAGQYLQKGGLVYVEGRIQTRKWQDKDGQERYTTEIIASEMKMLGGKSEGKPLESHPDGIVPPKRQAQTAAQAEAFIDDEIPF